MTPFPGTSAEYEAFSTAVLNNCACAFTPEGAQVSTCGAHSLYLAPQVISELVQRRRVRLAVEKAL